MNNESSGSDTVEFWDEIWDTMDHTFADYDQALVDNVDGLAPGRALDVGCGAGGNALWLAERGWRVTGIDFSGVAIEKARKRALGRGLEVELQVRDATEYRPEGEYDLITSFYIQLWPDQRARMLANAARALAPGGRILFVSHDKSVRPSGWSEDDLRSLTTPEEIVAELGGLRIEKVEVMQEAGADAAHTSAPDEGHSHECGESYEHGFPEDGERHSSGATTVVVAVRPLS